MASVTFDKATRLYPGGTRPAVDQIELTVKDGEFLVLVGPSGCGKTTTLRMLAGLEEVNEGRILIGDRDVTAVPPKDRDIAMVFQNYALYPHMTVAENMGFALKIAGIHKTERAARVLEAAKLLDLEPYLDRKPKALSGGQRQRVAMGRAIVRKPEVFLMDEPLSNLDAKLRVATRTQIASLQRRLGVTTVYVTHDQVEAMTMGDRVAVLKDGLLQQVDTPRALYERPANVFVAGFIGSPAMNLMKLKIVAGGVQFGNTTIKVDSAVLGKTKDKQVTVGLRPEDLIVTKNEGIAVHVNIVEELGADAFLYGTAEIEGEKVDVIARVGSKSSLRLGDKVYLKPQGGITHIFDIASGLRLNNDAPKAAKAVADKPAAKKPAAKKAAPKAAAKPVVKKAAPKAAAKPAVKKAAPKK
ncbi:MAG: sn-glycerol-3-phosphate ABC transporter ATP-binding protein UgpC [Micrococcales bacterium]|nr:sn-glycerol-3-phosphate ABC transporter ATP-binding protein UgpC [Actinomycetota bacterium]NCA08036.1 sn-glycerol-3-phosphate ABC transporter ATP-binding protein UgpC [Micrococcales bacterium]